MAAPPSLSSFTDLPAVKELPVSQRTTIPLTSADYDKFAASRVSVSFFQSLTSFLTRVVIVCSLIHTIDPDHALALEKFGASYLGSSCPFGHCLAHGFTVNGNIATMAPACACGVSTPTFGRSRRMLCRLLF